MQNVQNEIYLPLKENMLLQKIKADQLQSRKDRDSVKTSVLTTLIGEAESAAKSGKSLDDADVVALLKKFIKNIDELLAVSGINAEAQQLAVRERNTLVEYLPAQYSEQQLTEIISSMVVLNKTMGEIMTELKKSHTGLYDGALAAKLIKKLLS